MSLVLFFFDTDSFTNNTSFNIITLSEEGKRNQNLDPYVGYLSQIKESKTRSLLTLKKGKKKKKKVHKPTPRQLYKHSE